MHQDEHYKKLLFVDQSLEELVMQYNSENSLFSEPYQYWREKNLSAAIASLEQITNTPTSEVRHKLWAWKALQQMGEALPASIADEVQGVVFEIPVESWIDTLVVYSDGRLRYMNGMKGVDGLVIWENTEHPYIRPMIMPVISAATSLVGITPAATRHNETSPTTQPRITVITYGGLYVVDRDRETHHLTDPVLGAGTQLFTTLMQIVQQSNQR